MTRTLSIQEKWIVELKNGDEAAARHLYKMYSKAMYNTLIRIAGNQEDAQDLLQEAFIKAFKNIETYRSDSTFGAWLKRIVVNTGLEFLRSRKIHFEVWDETIPEPEMDSTENETYDINEIHEGIRQLPDGCRTVFSLYLLEGYTHDEIANQLKVSVSTSKTQYRRAKILLREQLKQQSHGRPN
jgi:RNA polymerase sigma-70 factor (ECF subfamily)